MPHKPVLLRETLELLDLREGMTVVDGTVGGGGHTEALLEKIGPTGRLIALDQDLNALEVCRNKFQGVSNLSLHHSNFKNLAMILNQLNRIKVNAVILDIGVSSHQLDNAERGFSFDKPGPLDMRMDQTQPQTAEDLIHDLSQDDLEKLFTEYGEERFARRFASAICQQRQTRRIQTTLDLAEVIETSLPRGLQFKKGHRPKAFRRHPATRVFQALRIAVNQELEVLREGIEAVWNHLDTGGRMAVIAFHSLEDRIVKNRFREWAQSGKGRLINKKAVQASRQEVLENVRSRSAKLRVIERKV